jgi:hypothetical protein
VDEPSEGYSRERAARIESSAAVQRRIASNLDFAVGQSLDLVSLNGDYSLYVATSLRFGRVR